jgi:hypothetical protein
MWRDSTAFRHFEKKEDRMQDVEVIPIFVSSFIILPSALS